MIKKAFFLGIGLSGAKFNFNA